MLKAYIAGPLRGDGTEHAITQNRAHAASVACDLWRAGFAVFCPHLNTTGMVGMFDKQDITGEAIFIAGDVLWLQHADCLFMLKSWRQSEGARCEHDFARSKDKILILYEHETEAGFLIWNYSGRLYQTCELRAALEISTL